MGLVINLPRSTIERTAVTPQETAHLKLLRFIEDRPEISQRELAKLMGVSVGKTHYLLKALLEKGLVKMDDFRRHGNKLAYVYLLTPSGISAKLSLTKSFLRHKEAEYQSLRGEITELQQELQATIRVDAP